MEILALLYAAAWAAKYFQFYARELQFFFGGGGGGRDHEISWGEQEEGVKEPCISHA